MFLQAKYFRANEGWDLEQQVNDFLQQLPREQLVSVKFCEQQVGQEMGSHFVSALVIFEA